jgi:hypothetical protein
MAKETRLYEKGLEEYPVAGAIIGNMVMIIWIALGAVGCWFFYPLIGLIYFVFALVMIYVILRKLVCPNCYYHGKCCHIGWGKLSAFMFKKGDIEDFPTSIGLKVAPLTYGLLTLIPLILIVISIFQEFLVSKAVILFILLAISFYSGTFGRKKACTVCKMRLICPGAAVK